LTLYWWRIDKQIFYRYDYKKTTTKISTGNASYSLTNGSMNGLQKASGNKPDEIFLLAY